jgi:hypothetical protein
MSGRGRPLAFDDVRLLRRLHAGLIDKGYVGDIVRDLVGHATMGAPADVTIADRTLDRSPLGTLTRLFVLARPAPLGEAAAALDPVTVDEAAALGLVEQRGDDVCSRVRLEPIGDLLIASDHASVTIETPVAPDHVVGAHLDTHRLAHLALDDPRGRALEIGTGCGVIALLVSRAARTVVATDVVPRALGFARFNTELNAIANVEFRLGSFLEPVEDDRFDLVLVNPPYVIGPEHALAYRDAGLRGDGVGRMLVTGIPALLNDDGVAQVLVSWIHDAGDDWDAPVRAWTAGRGCDTLLLRWGSEDAIGHAALWNLAAAEDPAAFAHALDLWIAYLAELGAARIAYGAVILRKREGGGRFERYDVPHTLLAASAEHVRRLLDAVADDEPPLERALRLVAGHALRRDARIEGGVATAEHLRLQLLEGLQLEVGIDQPTLDLLLRLDGRPLGDILAEYDVRHVDRAAFVRAAVGATDRLRLLGFLDRA